MMWPSLAIVEGPEISAKRPSYVHTKPGFYATVSNPLTLADLKEALKGLATKEDLKALAPQETVNAIMETVAETQESVTELTGLMKDTLQELTATHEDVRYVRTTVTMQARGDAAHEAAIESLRKRLERVERKVGIAK